MGRSDIRLGRSVLGWALFILIVGGYWKQTEDVELGMIESSRASNETSRLS